jgi:hypothetical protein
MANSPLADCVHTPKSDTQFLPDVFYSDRDGLGRHVEYCSRAVGYVERTFTGAVGTLKNLKFEERRLNFKSLQFIVKKNNGAGETVVVSRGDTEAAFNSVK